LLELARGRAAQRPKLTSDILAAAAKHGMETVAVDQIAPRRSIAMQLAYEAAVSQARTLGDALSGMPVILLKGVGLGSRFYDAPWSRTFTDLDLLVRPRDLARAEAILGVLGYRCVDGERERFFRERHFHIELRTTGVLPLELHFKAYAGFGGELPADLMLEGAAPIVGLSQHLLAPAPAAELVYLAAHAATHRFVRMGWVYDMVRLHAHHSNVVADARKIADATGFRAVLEFALVLMHDLFGSSVDTSRRHRTTLVRWLAPEPAAPPMRTLTRFLYTQLLCDTHGARLRQAARSITDRSIYGV
jgi:hypothetical protein